MRNRQLSAQRLVEAVDKLAATGSSHIPFPRPMLNDGLNFSFSGLKSAVARHIAHSPEDKPEDITASFVEACMEVLLTKCKQALLAHPSQSLAVVGGVAASPQLRARAKSLCEEMGVELCLPPLRWATDNAAMIALAAWDYVDLPNPPGPVPNTSLTLTEY